MYLWAAAAACIRTYISGIILGLADSCIYMLVSNKAYVIYSNLASICHS